MIPYRKLRARIEQDKEKKKQRRRAAHEQYDCLENVFTPRHYVKGVMKCRKGVGYKLSVQRYCARPFKKIAGDCGSMLRGEAPQVSSSKKEIILERGKERVITPIKIQDRVNQRVLCDWALTPMITPRLIYDNGASMAGKGVSFARNRFNAMLEKAKRLWGDDFYVLTFDFKKFFDSIPHRLCVEELNKTFNDKRIVDITMQVVEGYQMLDAKASGDTEVEERLRRHEGIGVCLGSHVSQLMALCVPNFLVHFVNDVKRIRFYIRYMDDGIIIHNDRDYLAALLTEMEEICTLHGMKLNMQKTHITKIRHGVKFLKVRYRVKGMKTIKRLCRDSVIRMRRKLKRFVGLVENGKMTMKMVDDSMISWVGHTKHAMAYRQRKRMMQHYCFLFGRGGVSASCITKSYRTETSSELDSIS